MMHGWQVAHTAVPTSARTHPASRVEQATPAASAPAQLTPTTIDRQPFLSQRPFRGWQIQVLGQRGHHAVLLEQGPKDRLVAEHGVGALP